MTRGIAMRYVPKLTLSKGYSEKYICLDGSACREERNRECTSNLTCINKKVVIVDV